MPTTLSGLSLLELLRARLQEGRRHWMGRFLGACVVTKLGATTWMRMRSRLAER